MSHNKFFREISSLISISGFGITLHLVFCCRNSHISNG
ncbi:hypothetical protein LEP1GSC125_2805 [Leptospira mayottensis 200901122]|uniref:Uncharacterized protein n=1 Tax=Leptospira mayottensis 200901122 TaxID=1193010 RepID=A0AA87SVF6_9LEPT|nr:hypothetical protein LEP1GSC125_2805 [Leptospira mayottensis 200901122]